MITSWNKNSKIINSSYILLTIATGIVLIYLSSNITALGQCDYSRTIGRFLTGGKFTIVLTPIHTGLLTIIQTAKICSRRPLDFD